MLKNNKNGSFSSVTLLVPEIKQLIKEKKFFELKDVINEIHPIDLAEGFHNFDKEEQLIIFRLLKSNRAIAVFEDLEPEEQSWIIENLDKNPLEKLVEDMPADERGKLVRKLPDRVRKKLLSCIKHEDLRVIQQTLNYKEGVAGAIMNTYFISLSPNMTSRQAIEYIQALSKFRRYASLHAFYVIDENRKLLGGVTLRKLIAAPSDIKVKEIMSSVSFIKVNHLTSVEDVAKLFMKYDLIVSPVVDDNDVLLGVITVDDVVDIINEINARQIYEIGKIAGKEEIKYQNATSWYLFKRRIGWLVILLFINFLSGSVLQTFEKAIATVIALTFFVPMLIDTGGNAGSQTATLIIRGLSTGDVSFRNILSVVKLELITAILLGVGVGTVGFIRGLSVGGNIMLAIVVSSSLFFIVLLGVVTGIVLPIISKKLKIDPAIVSAPLITSIVDVCGLIIYFNIAKLFLPQLKNI
ncbi:MAG: magnesium transporter [Endomicrobia bacterium]|nr:magnesium transporter [Endomicrobiia bacterium]MCX7940265.1 magnesium transporter [Endomicrobiia bacterium]MDW8055831.1 magnesium transporter [Elusimicrobiota bacterium]